MGLKTKDNRRYSGDEFFGQADDNEAGRFFVTSTGDEWDSHLVSVVHCGIDTVKQLYSGFVKLDRYQFIEDAYNNKTYQIMLDGVVWDISSGRRGGYRYILKNSDIGILVLLGSFYTEPKYEGHHLKIELSPHFIIPRAIDMIQELLDYYAALFIHQFTHTGVAIHLCADVQGWIPPDDLDRRLTTRAKVVKYSGATSMEFERHSIATVHGRGETFTFGGAGSLQFTVYNKSKLIAKNQRDKEYWESIYNTHLDIETDKPFYKPDVDVYRIEVRFHHSVVAQFALGLSLDLRCFKDVVEHLNGFWQYALNNFRLDASRTYIDCFWQHMRDDVSFNQAVNAIVYQRCFKKNEWDCPPSDRTLKILFGILCGVYRRAKYTLEQAWDYLSNSGIAHYLFALYERSVFNPDYDDLVIELAIRDDLQRKLFPPLPISCD